MAHNLEKTTNVLQDFNAINQSKHLRTTIFCKCAWWRNG